MDLYSLLYILYNIYVFYISTFRLAIPLILVDTKAVLWYNNIVDTGKGVKMSVQKTCILSAAHFYSCNKASSLKEAINSVNSIQTYTIIRRCRTFKCGIVVYKDFFCPHLYCGLFYYKVYCRTACNRV